MSVSTRRGEARRGDHRACTRELWQVAAIPGMLPCALSYAFLLPCTCLLFVRSTLCVSLVPVATKDSCWVQKMVTYTSWCCPRNLVTSVSRRRIYCVALSNEMSTRGLEFAHESWCRLVLLPWLCVSEVVGVQEYSTEKRVCQFNWAEHRPGSLRSQGRRCWQKPGVCGVLCWLFSVFATWAANSEYWKAYRECHVSMDFQVSQKLVSAFDESVAFAKDRQGRFGEWVKPRIYLLWSHIHVSQASNKGIYICYLNLHFGILTSQ